MSVPRSGLHSCWHSTGSQGGLGGQDPTLTVPTSAQQVSVPQESRSPDLTGREPRAVVAGTQLG